MHRYMYNYMYIHYIYIYYVMKLHGNNEQQEALRLPEKNIAVVIRPIQSWQ